LSFVLSIHASDKFGLTSFSKYFSIGILNGILSKSLRPLPLPKVDSEGKEYDSFSDPESRYRQRYVDLIVNPEVKETFILRTKLTNSMRSFLNKKGYLEVETPILQPIYGGASAKPFVTHHNKLDMKLYLRIANELYLKRLIVGGFEGVYEFSKDFRNEGMSRFHNPEFTQMELYVAYKDYDWMMCLVEKMVENIALDLHGTTKVSYDNKEIDFKSPWKRLPMFEIIKENIGVDISNMGEEDLKNLCSELKIKLESNEIKNITFYTSPEGKVHPEDKLDPNLKLLEGFVWRIRERPESLEDLFK